MFLQADSFPAEPPGKPKNTGVGSLTLLQGIFQTQELNQGLLPCRQILYQRSYQGSPSIIIPHRIKLHLEEQGKDNQKEKRIGISGMNKCKQE